MFVWLALEVLKLRVLLTVTPPHHEVACVSLASVLLILSLHEMRQRGVQVVIPLNSLPCPSFLHL